MLALTSTNDLINQKKNLTHYPIYQVFLTFWYSHTPKSFFYSFLYNNICKNDLAPIRKLNTLFFFKKRRFWKTLSCLICFGTKLFLFISYSQLFVLYFVSFVFISFLNCNFFFQFFRDKFCFKCLFIIS